MRPPATAVAGILATLVALQLGAADAGAAREPKKPKRADLVVTDLDVRGKPYYVNNSESATSAVVRVKNDGRAAAGNSKVPVRIQGGGGEPIRLGRASLPGIDPGRSKRATIDFGLRREVLPAGKYAVSVCADMPDRVKESDEGNNCKRATEPFYVAHQSFRGTIIGQAPLNPLAGSSNARETWNSENATFTLDRYWGGGMFTYRLSGTARYVTSGTDGGGCTWSGSGTVNRFDPFLVATLELNGEVYGANAGSSGFSYTQYQDCGGVTTEWPGPYEPLLLATEQNLPLPFGTATLSGSEPTDLGGHQSWNLSAVN